MVQFGLTTYKYNYLSEGSRRLSGIDLFLTWLILAGSPRVQKHLIYSFYLP